MRSSTNQIVRSIMNTPFSRFLADRVASERGLNAEHVLVLSIQSFLIHVILGKLNKWRASNTKATIESVADEMMHLGYPTLGLAALGIGISKYVVRNRPRLYVPRRFVRERAKIADGRTHGRAAQLQWAREAWESVATEHETLKYFDAFY